MARHKLTLGVAVIALVAAYAACSAFSGTEEQGGPADAGGADSPTDAGANPVDVAIVFPDVGVADDAGQGSTGSGYRLCPDPPAIEADAGITDNPAWTAQLSNCAGTSSASAVGGVACEELTCAAQSPAWDDYLSPELPLDLRLDVVFNVAFVSNGNPPHVFAQVTPQYVNGQNLSFAVSAGQITASIGTASPSPLATWTNLDLTQPATIEVHVDVGSGALATFKLGVNGDLRSITPPTFGSGPLQLQIGPYIPAVNTATLAADDCYFGVRMWTCH